MFLTGMFNSIAKKGALLSGFDLIKSKSEFTPSFTPSSIKSVSCVEKTTTRNPFWKFSNNGDFKP